MERSASPANVWVTLLVAGVVAGVIGGAVAGCSPTRSRTTADVGIGSTPHQELRRADALGLTPTAALSMLPLAAGEVATALDDADPRVEYSPVEWEASTPDEREMLRLLESYAEEIEERRDPSDAEETFFEPLREAKLRFAWVDGPVRFYNEQGRRYEEGFNLHASTRSTARLWDRLLLSAEPQISYVENRGSPDGEGTVLGTFQELTAKAHLEVVEVTVGRHPMWWGPGWHGSLLMSNNAQGLDLVKVATPDAVLFPGIFGYLGLVRAEFVLSELDENRPVSRPYLLGMRASSRLNPWLEIGISRAAMFGGGERTVTPTTVWRAITAQRLRPDEEGREQLSSLDFRILIPLPWQPVETYLEYGGADEASGFLEAPGYIAGLYLPRIGPWMGGQLRFEVADTSLSDRPGAWYGDRSYPGGYSHKGQVLGHHVGTDGLDLYLSLTIEPHRGWRVRLSYDYEEHFRLDPVTERLHQFFVAVEHEVIDGLLLSAYYRHDRWHHYGQQAGVEEDGHATGLGLFWSF